VFALFVSVLFYTDVAAYMFQEGFNDLTDNVQQFAETSAIEITRSPATTESGIERKVANLKSQFSELSMAVVPVKPSSAGMLAAGARRRARGPEAGAQRGRVSRGVPRGGAARGTSRRRSASGHSRRGADRGRVAPGPRRSAGRHRRRDAARRPNEHANSRHYDPDGHRGDGSALYHRLADGRRRALRLSEHRC